MDYHVPVMLQECVTALDIKPAGTYLDVTFGGGGHSRKILEKLTTGRLIAFDQDQDAAAIAMDLEVQAKRSFLFVPSNFRYVKKYLKFHGITEVDGILADLGVSSHHINEASRGFSTRLSGELDMRMDQRTTRTAREVVNTYAEKDLIHIISLYGEIKNARTLAQAIVRERNRNELITTDQLTAIAEQVGPRQRIHKYAAQLFQALRIEVNDELGVLKAFLESVPEILTSTGRLVVMSYHSLEDRLVKNFISSGNFQGKPEKDFYGNLLRPLDPLVRKPILPQQEEIERNNRARSAKLRIGIRR